MIQLFKTTCRGQQGRSQGGQKKASQQKFDDERLGVKPKALSQIEKVSDPSTLENAWALQKNVLELHSASEK